MNKYKKIISGFLLSSIIFGNINFSFAAEQTLSLEDTKKVNAEIVSLQTSVFNNSKSLLEKMISEVKLASNYEENGNSNLTLDIDEDSFGKINGSLNLKDYKLKNSGINNQIDSNLDLQAKYEPKYGSGEEISLKTFVSLINKDSQMYALLKDFDFKVTDENISKILEEVKKQFSDNKYVTLPTDENAKIVLSQLKDLSIDGIFSQTKEILSKPLFEAYKKEGNRYYLVPSRYACETYFSLEQKFNQANSWYKPKTCSDVVYKKLMFDAKRDGDFYLDIGETENIFGFISSKKSADNVDMRVYYNTDSITKVYISVKPDQKLYKGEGFLFEYSKNKFVNIDFNEGKGKNKFVLKSTLDNNNNFLTINGSYNFDKELVGNITLINKKLSIFGVIKEKGYDYTSKNWEYKLKNIYGYKLTANLGEKNKIDNFNFKLIGLDVKTKKPFLNANLALVNTILNGNLKINTIGGDVNASLGGKVLENYFSSDVKFSFDEYKGDLSLVVDQTNNKNYSLVSLLLNNSKKDILKLKATTDAKREYKSDIKIEVPTNVKELDLDKIYGEQKKIARDTKRMNDIKAIQSAIEQSYQDTAEYPTIENFSSTVKNYLYTMQLDPLDGQTINGCKFGYMYGVGDDENGIKNGAYKLSTCFESNKFIESKSKADGGLDANKWEIGNGITNKNIKDFFIK